MYKFVNMLKATLVAGLMAVMFLVPMAAHAVDVTSKACSEIPDSTACRAVAKGTTNNPLFGPDGILTRAIEILSIVGGVIAIIVLIIAGVRFVTSQGNSQTVNTARNQIIYAIVGLVVVGLAQGIVRLVLNKL